MLKVILVLAPLIFTQQDIPGVKAKVEKVRGLCFLDAVQVGRYSQEELKNFIVKQIPLSMPDTFFYELQKTFEAFEIIRKEEDIKEILLDMWTSQIAGFYHPATKELKLIDMDSADSIQQNYADQITIPHELIHALTDQHFNLLKFQLSDVSDDTDLAFTALIEGDATLFGMKSFLGTERFESMKRMISTTMRKSIGQSGDKYPLFLMKSFIFPYTDGYDFVLYIYEKEGIEGVNKLYSSPPVSTEQIIHPQKYGNDFPQSVKTTKELRKLFTGNKYKYVTEGVMGELGIKLLIKHRKNKGADKVSSGWDGDRYIIFESPEEELTLIWYTIWDSGKDAEEFETYYKAYLDKNNSYRSAVYRSENRAIMIMRIPEDIDLLKNPTFEQLDQWFKIQELNTIELTIPVLM